MAASTLRTKSVLHHLGSKFVQPKLSDTLVRRAASVSAVTSGKVDTHIHVVPPIFRKTLLQHGGDPSGWKIPEWTSDKTLAFMDTAGIAFGVLSLTAPGPIMPGSGHQQNRTLAAACNDFTADVVAAHPDKLGYFACLPSLLVAHDTVAEVERVRSLAQQPLGFVVYSNYDSKYLGNPEFEAVWQALDSMKAVVFIHPTHGPQGSFTSSIPQPVHIYPHDTTCTALDLVVSGTLDKYPNIKFVLSHAGGTIPFLADRLTMATMVQGLHTSGISPSSFKAEFRRFYYDCALTSDPKCLELLRSLVGEDRILFGSDYPYAPEAVSLAVVEQFDRWTGSDSSLNKAIAGNAATLFGGQLPVSGA